MESACFNLVLRNVEKLRYLELIDKPIRFLITIFNQWRQCSGSLTLIYFRAIPASHVWHLHSFFCLKLLIYQAPLYFVEYPCYDKNFHIYPTFWHYIHISTYTSRVGIDRRTSVTCVTGTEWPIFFLCVYWIPCSWGNTTLVQLPEMESSNGSFSKSN